MSGSFEDILVKTFGVTLEKIEQARAFAVHNACTLAQALVRTHACTQRQVSTALAQSKGLKLVDLSKIKIKIKPEVIALVPSDLAQELRLVPVVAKGGTLVVAMAEDQLDALDTVAFMTSLRVVCVIATPEDIEAALEQYYGAKAMQQALSEAQKSGLVAVRQDGDAGQDADANDAPIIKYVDGVISKAVTQRASDIHVEPFEDEVRVRFRIDGVLRTVDTVPKRIQGPVISRIKIKAGMDMAEKRRPQSGRILVSVHGRQIDLRASALPARHGESMVMRILDKGKGLVDLEELGFHETDFTRFERIIQRPNGIFLVTGPTGSGKTTTLYAALKKLNRPTVNIETAENPVEYSIDGLNQSQVRHDIKLDFQRILRAMMRQAPNIILIGEIRDHETADIAIQAALTGHLVFSTLHTNDAPSAITRLIDMKVKPYLVSTAIMAVMGQRLVRTLCLACRKPYDPTEMELASIGLQRVQLGEATLYDAVGCKQCGGQGYRGRKGIFELMEMSEQIRQLAYAKSPVNLIRAAAHTEGMVTLQEDAVRKVLAGITTIREILRVTHSQV